MTDMNRPGALAGAAGPGAVLAASGTDPTLSPAAIPGNRRSPRQAAIEALRRAAQTARAVLDRPDAEAVIAALATVAMHFGDLTNRDRRLARAVAVQHRMGRERATDGASRCRIAAERIRALPERRAAT